MEEVYAFLKQAGVYWIATAEGDRPHLRPFGTVDVFEGALYIQTGRKKAVADQLKANPNIELCAMIEQRWIRLSAKAVLDPRLEPQEHMLEAYPMLRGMYAPGDGNNEVYRLEDVTACINCFGEEPKVFRF